MATKVGEYLRHDPIKLRFTTTHASNGSPKAVLKRSLNQSIAEIMAPNYISPTTTVILYEKLDVSIVELETKRSLKVVWTGINNKEELSYPFLLPKTSMVHDLADHLSKQVTLSPEGTGKIRIFEISKDGKMQKEFTGSEMIGNIPDPVELYAEVCVHHHRGVQPDHNTLFLNRKSPRKNSRQTTLTRSSEYSTSRKSWSGPTVYLSNLW